MKKIIKWCVIGALILCIILGIAGYVAYRNRAAIAHKMVTYTMQSITGSKNSSEQTWLGAFLGSKEAENIKNAFLTSLIKNNEDKNSDAGNNSAAQNRKPGLATIAEMLANGAGGEGIDIKKTAQILLSKMDNYDAEHNEISHDINARDAKGRTLLMNVCRVDVTPKVIKMLLNYGAEINAVDENGRNALMYATALNENPEVVQMLLDNGADFKAKDIKGYNAYDHAKNADVQRVIEKYTKRNRWF